MTESQSLAELELAARGALTSSPIVALQKLEVCNQGNRLLLSGRVSTFYHKQLAQEVVRAVADGVQLINTITVD
jgi:hypothetical protein